EIRPDGPVVERVNPAFEETFGYDASEVVGENLDELIVPEGSQAGAVDINEQLLGGERIRTEVQRLTPDGVRDFRLDVVGRENSNEGYAIYTDVTRSKRRQRRLERQNERLEKFVSVVSHDLRTPLSVAMGNLELADEEYDDPRLADAADAVDRMDALINDLLTLAREGEHVNEVETVDLGAVAGDCWEGLDTEAATLETGAAPEIEADRSRVRQLLSNLLRNAVEHSSTSPPSQAREDAGSENASEPSVASAPDNAVEHGSRNVTVTVGDLADGFHVSDDGPGIPESDRDRIFESGFTPPRSSRPTAGRFARPRAPTAAPASR
ncbi:histidine kinase, partial [Halobacteriales archaeon QS_7_69_60]